MMQPTDATPQTRPTPTQLSRQQIMQVTAACLYEVGYDQTTIRRIAGQLDCAIGSIYRYFTDKRELLYAVTQQQFEPVAALAESAGPFEASLRMYRERATQVPQMYRLMFWLASLPSGNNSQPTGDGSAAGTDAATGQHAVPEVVERIIAGWSRMLNDAALARQCWALLHGAIMLGDHGPGVIDTLLRLGQARQRAAGAVAAEARARSSEATAIAAAAASDERQPQPEKAEDVYML